MMKIKQRMRHCPFCGGCIETVVCDHEGNIHNDAYEHDPWSGLGYMLRHKETNFFGGCPIDLHGESYDIIYDTRKEAEAAWSYRISWLHRLRRLWKIKNKEKYL